MVFPWKVTHYRKNYCPIALAIFWVLGAAMGVIYADSIGQRGVSLICDAVTVPMSFSGMLVVNVFPFLISGLAIMFGKLWLVPVLGGMKAFGFCFNASAVSMAFGNGGWLVRCLLLFSDIFMIPAFCVFCLRYSVVSYRRLRQEWYVWVILVTVVGCLDYCLVSPFLVRLF